jgi:hypothetical protein
MYKVTKQFTSGIMFGVVLTETTSVKFTVGDKIKPCAGNSSYIVLSVEAV